MAAPDGSAMAAAAAELAMRYTAGGGHWDFHLRAPVNVGTVCVARVDSAIFASATSSKQIGEVACGEQVVASGPPVMTNFYHMVPIWPHGAVDLAVLEPLKCTAERPCAVGSWDGYAKNEMLWDEGEKCYHLSVELGDTGSERFQILYDGDYRKCLHPDVDNSSPHEPYRLCGPDKDGDGKDWVIGRHPADRGAKGVSFQIRLFLCDDGSAKHVDWLRTSEAEGLEAQDAKGETVVPTGPELQGELPKVLDTVDVDARPERHNLHQGLSVLIDGLKGPPSAELNGAEAVCECWDPATGRWRVRLPRGEPRDLSPGHLRPLCGDVSGFWRSGSDISRIVQDGADVVVTCPGQAWSPAAGSVNGQVLTMAVPSEIPCFAAAFSDGEIRWVNNTVWYRTTEAEWATAAAKQSKRRVDKFSRARDDFQRGAQLEGSDRRDSSSDEDVAQVAGPVAQYLRASRRGATRRGGWAST